MPYDAIVRVIYKEHVATCYNPEDGDLARLGLKLLEELDQAHSRPESFNEYINLLQNIKVVNKNIRPTDEQKEQLLPYTHIRLDRPGDGDSWSALLYGTRGGFDAMLRAGIWLDNMIFPMNVSYVYTIDLYSRTIHVMSYPDSSQQTYRTDETNMIREGWERNCFWSPVVDENRIVDDDANNIIPDGEPNPDNINYREEN